MEKHNCQSLTPQELELVSGGRRTSRLRKLPSSYTLRPKEPPVYYTLAIGESGGNLPETSLM